MQLVFRSNNIYNPQEKVSKLEIQKIADIFDKIIYNFNKKIKHGGEGAPLAPIYHKF